MTITELLAYGATPPSFATSFLQRIRGFVPVGAFLREGNCPRGGYLVPFVDRRGEVMGWVCFAPQLSRKAVSVRLDYHSDPTRIYRVGEDGTLEVAHKTINEDW